MIRIFVDDDLIAIPEPVIAEIVVVGGHAEVEAVEKEAVSGSTGQTENVTPSKAARKPSMFKGTINVVMGIVTSRIVADPLIVGVHVGRVGMSGLIDKSPRSE